MSIWKLVQNIYKPPLGLALPWERNTFEKYGVKYAFFFFNCKTSHWCALSISKKHTQALLGTGEWEANGNRERRKPGKEEKEMRWVAWAWRSSSVTSPSSFPRTDCSTGTGALSYSHSRPRWVECPLDVLVWFFQSQPRTCRLGEGRGKDLVVWHMINFLSPWLCQCLG